jgi:hypothetical protein
MKSAAKLIYYALGGIYAAAIVFVQIPNTQRIYEHAASIARVGVEYAIKPRGGEVRYVDFADGVLYDLHLYLAPLIILHLVLGFWVFREK